MKLINLKGDLFATAFCFGAQAIIKIVGSAILTRILHPEAYGVIALLTSIVFVVEMLSDVGLVFALVRHERGDEPAYLNTAWTLRLIRGLISGALLFFCAPLLTTLYQAPQLAAPLRVFAIWFVVNGLESMSFAVALRRKNTRIVMYSELVASLLSTIGAVAYCWVARNFWGMVFGTLFNRALMVAFSYCFYRDIKPRLQFDRAIARELFQYTRYIMPSSLLTLALSQFDKIVFLRLFSLELLGIYGLASNIASTVEGLITRISQMVLYPRNAFNFRNDRESFASKYYSENVRLFAAILIAPAAVGGAARLIVSVLYDSRYAAAATVLQAFMLRAVLLSLSSPAEELLNAAGHVYVNLVANILRAIWMVGASLLGYWIFGFTGFVYGVALSGLPPLLYFFFVQHSKGFMTFRFEAYKTVLATVVAIAAYICSSALLQVVPHHGVS